MADEEVHFSRNPLESSEFYYYSYDQHQTHNNCEFGATGCVLQPVAGEQQAPNCDQVTSSRLLNSISSRLRRGSNYLNASKVVGQYLLGITIQNWSEFFNTSRMLSTPSSRHQLTRRLLTNLSYFQGNYLCVSLVLVIYCILTLPLLLLAIAIYLLALYLATVRSALGKQTRVFGYRLNLQQQYSFITILSLAPLWCAGAPSALFWVIGASFFVVGLHASMYANERALAAELSTPARVLSLPAATAGQQPRHEALPRRQSAADHQHKHLASGHDTPTAVCQPPEVARSRATNYMPVALSQWIPFAAGASFDQPDGGARRSPEVKIISQEFAGLGRVYEV